MGNHLHSHSVTPVIGVTTVTAVTAVTPVTRVAGAPATDRVTAVTGDSHLVAVRLKQRFEEHMASIAGSEAQPEIAATGAVLAMLVTQAAERPGPWLDAGITVPAEMAAALRAQIEAVDATNARHIRRPGARLLSDAEGDFLLSLATRLCGSSRPVTCRELVRLAGLVARAKLSPHATAGDPNFIWKRRPAAPTTRSAGTA